VVVGCLGSGVQRVACRVQVRVTMRVFRVTMRSIIRMTISSLPETLTILILLLTVTRNTHHEKHSQNGPRNEGDEKEFG